MNLSNRSEVLISVLTVLELIAHIMSCLSNRTIRFFLYLKVYLSLINIRRHQADTNRHENNKTLHMALNTLIPNIQYTECLTH